MKKLLKSMACFAAAALVGTSAFARAGWLGAGAIYIGEKVEEGVCNGWYYADSHSSTTWCNGGPFGGADLGNLTSLTLGGQVQLWDESSADWGWGSTAKMYYSIDGGTAQLITMDYYKFESNNNFFQVGGNPMVAVEVSLAGLNPGAHTLAVYFDDYDSAKTTPTYTATFTIPEIKVVTFDGNGEGVEGVPDTLYCEVGGVYKEGGIPSPTRTNYRFRGWYTDPRNGYGERIRGHYIVENADPMTLWAHWDQRRQTVTFHANGDGAVLLKDEARFDQGGTYSGSVFTMKGATWANHKFLGWYDQAEGGSPVQWGDTVTSEDTRELFAHWRQYRQVVTFHANGEGASVLKDEARFDCGGTYTGSPFTMNGATWDNHYFMGWYDEATGERVWWGDEVTADFERDLYAHWRAAAAPAFTGLSFASKAANGKRSATTTDVLTVDSLGITATAYNNGNFSNKKVTSDALYAGQAIKNGNPAYIQIRKTSPGGIVTTASGGKAKKVTVAWNSGNTSGRYLTVYGKNSAYSTAADLYSSSTYGTELGTITVASSPTSLDITGDYEYIGLLASGAIYMDSVSIEWASGEPTVTLEASATEVYVNEPVTINASAEGFSVGADQLIWEWKVNGTVDTAQTSTNYNLDTSAANTYVVTAEATDATSITNASVSITVKTPSTPHTVTIVTDGNGTVTAEPTSAMEGQTVTLTAVPNEGYRLDYVASAQVEITDLSFVMPNENVNVNAFFEGKHAINVTTDGNGTALPDAATAFSGATITLTVTPNPGYALDAITVNDGAVEVTGTSFVMPKAVANVRVTFKETVEFEQITSLDNLKPGEYVIAWGTTAMKAAVNSGNTKFILTNEVALTIEGSSVFDPADAIVWTLAQVDNGWTIYNEDVGYAYYSGSGNTAASEADYTDKSTWTIALSGDNDGLFLVQNVGTTGRYLKYNSSQPRFACYTGGQKNLAFYKKKVAAQIKVVTFDGNGEGVQGVPDTLYCEVGGVYKEGGIPSPTRTNYRFRGWYTDPRNGYGERIRGHYIVENADPMTLWAHWDQRRQTVTFNANGEGAELLKTEARFDQGGTYSGSVFTMKGATWANHKFLGWYDQAEGGSPVQWGDTVTSEDTRELFAHWRQYRQVVTFHANGEGASVLKDEARFDCGGTYTGSPFTMNGATWDNHYFMGWYDEATGERVWWGDEVTADFERDLYAHWRAAAAPAFTGLSFASKAAKGARSADSATVACTLWINALAGDVCEISWASAMDGEWTLLKRWTAAVDGNTAVTVDVPADSPTGFFRLAVVGVE